MNRPSPSVVSCSVRLVRPLIVPQTWKVFFASEVKMADMHGAVYILVSSDKSSFEDYYTEPAAEFQMMRNFRIRGGEEASPPSCAGFYCRETRLAQLTFRAVMYLNFWKNWREKTKLDTEISEVLSDLR